ncbi:MAG: ATP-dependent helicase [Anaerolineae bacterium]|nr:DEAD/DEAH box helicase [Anaerolineales bacterium]MCQ3973823.1 ATP-dependent helicase [Anaerolineae bacterium]
MSLSTLLDIWRDTPSIAANITAWWTFPARPGQFAPFPPDLHPALAAALESRSIEALYTHQAAAWQHIHAGRHPVIVTGTASGKTLCYNLPILDRLLRHPDARALYLFPTKALAQDQAEALRNLVSNQKSVSSNQKKEIRNKNLEQRASQSPISNLQSLVATYDGDTPTSARPAIRQNARLVITNPDMLHSGILPHHTRWADFFHRLQFVVIDEMHVYRGVFGSHIANVLRRLKRVARFYGAAPQFILTSATIANPAELAERLIEEPIALVDEDGAARGAKHFVIYNPPIVDYDLGLRRSALQETVRLSRELLTHNIQTLIFGRARRSVEMILKYLKDEGGTLRVKDEKEISAFILHPSFFEVRAYRSGYLPRQRREIERGLREGQVRAVVATTALELGIDIGGLDAAVLAGYPGTIAGTWQQAGRAGRQQDDSLALLIATANPLDQFLAHHPDYFFERSPEQALINPDNWLILLQHLRCAAFELPFRRGEGFGRVDAALLAEFLQFLQAGGELHASAETFFWMADHYPAEGVSLRSASPERVLLQVEVADGLTTIGEVDGASAPWMVHPQAIYLHEGQSYLVETLDLEQNLARLRPSQADYYTEPKRETTVQLVTTSRTDVVPGAAKAFGEIVVTTQVVGYRQRRWFSNEPLGEGELSLPPAELQTTGYWLALTEATVEQLRAQGLWSNDPNDYGPNWAAQRRAARARDGYRCQMCGLPERGREHDVHHKIPFRTFASYEPANQLSNLITLCRSCHRRAETAVRVRSGLGGLAFTLSHLAPLFLMCDANDVAVHHDPQSPLTFGQPAVVIYETTPGGLGFSERLFDLHADLMGHAHELVAACGCADGCPSCVGPGGEEGRGGKREALAILEALV